MLYAICYTLYPVLGSGTRDETRFISRAENSISLKIVTVYLDTRQHAFLPTESYRLLSRHIRYLIHRHTASTFESHS